MIIGIDIEKKRIKLIKSKKINHDHFFCDFLAIALCLALTLGRCTGESSDEDEDESSDEHDDEEDYYCFFLLIFLSFAGMMLIFLIDLLYMSFHHSSFQFVGWFWLFTPRPKPSSLLLICTHSVVPCCFFPSPLPSFHPICDINFLAYSLSNLVFETPDDCKSLYLYLADIFSQQ